MFRTCLVASVAALTLAASSASALTPVGISQIDTNGDGKLSVGEMRAGGMSAFAAAVADANQDGVLSREEREIYNRFLEIEAMLADPAKRAEIVAHFAANPRDATQPDATTVAETLADAHESIRWRRAYYSDDNYIWSEMPGKIASEAIKDRLRWIFAEPAKLIETFEAEKASEQRRLARAEQRRLHDDDDDKTPVVVASTPAPTGGDDTPDTPPGGGEALTPVPEPEGPFGPGDDPFGPGGEPEDDFGPGGEFDVGGEDDFGSEG